MSKATEIIKNTHYPKLLIKFPTRSRVVKFFNTLDIYYKLLSNKCDVEFLITCDNDYLSMNNSTVRDRFKTYSNLEVEYGDSQTKIEAINTGVSQRNFDIILLASDDMIPVVSGYDLIIINKMRENFPDFDGILWFNDGLQQERLNTLCILGRPYYNRFNYIYNPEYKSLWCDVEFTQVGYLLKKQKYFNQTIIKHNHYSVINEDADVLYTKNDMDNDVDKITYLKRYTNNFYLC